MRHALMVRLLGILLLAGSTLIAPVVGVPAGSAVAQQDGKGEEGKGNKDDKKDKKVKDKKKGDAELSETEGYVVDVVCHFDDAASTTTCTFTGVAPEGASDVGHIQLPEDAACSTVVGGVHEYVDPDPHTNVPGYKSKGQEPAFTLTLEGEVTTAGTSVYWFKTGNGVFPGLGPGLLCDPQRPGTVASPDASNESPDGTATATDMTGEVVIEVYRCATDPVDSATFDWFGECDLASNSHQFTLQPLSDPAGDPMTTASDGSGHASFDALAPGLYNLELTGVNWCHATSNNVDAEGKVIVEEGERTTVWIFTCESEG
jgi:hypothetical protein